MIKKCKITHIINPPIYGVVNKPIREGHIVDLNCGQILTCLGISTVDEILPTGALVRLNKDNYKTDNTGITKEITIEDSVGTIDLANVEKTDKTDEEPKVEEVKTENPVIPNEDQKVDKTTEESKVEEVKTEESSLEKTEETSDATTEEPKVEEAATGTEEVKTETATVERNNNVNPPKKKRK